MNYEELLEQAYERISPIEKEERFEIMKVAGHHEGTKTIVTNFCRIACFICRDPEHLMKFLGKELASSVEISNERLVFSRRLSSKEINEKIKKYVNQFVLCPKCRKPDTEIIEERGKCFLKCMACGGEYEVHKI